MTHRLKHFKPLVLFNFGDYGSLKMILRKIKYFTKKKLLRSADRYKGFLSLSMVSVWVNHNKDCWCDRRRTSTRFTRRAGPRRSVPNKPVIHRVLHPNIWTEGLSGSKAVGKGASEKTTAVSGGVCSRTWGSSEGMGWGWSLRIKTSQNLTWATKV